jgi:hypothetical protein
VNLLYATLVAPLSFALWGLVEGAPDSPGWFVAASAVISMALMLRKFFSGFVTRAELAQELQSLKRLIRRKRTPKKPARKETPNA